MADFDVFISFKNSDAYQNITPDYKIAAKLQTELEKRGLRTFFSGNSIKMVGDSEYKKVIDEALDSADVLVVVGTKLSYIRSKWVEYEWESFANDILSGIKENSKILTYTSEIDTRELPRTLRTYQNFVIDHDSVGDVCDFICSLHKKIKSDNESGYHSGDFEENYTAGYSVKDDSEIKNKREHPMQKSVYTPALKSEFRRLKIQAGNSLDSDQKVIDYVMQKMSGQEKMTVLDVGCAYGLVTASRFSHIPNVGHIIAIDNNADVIDQAKNIHMDNDKILFYVMDLESEEFEDEISELLEEMDIQKVDLIFSSLVIHHLKNPDKVLRRLRKFLKKDGYIIIRGSDDGSKLCYPCSELMEKIIEKTMEAVGVSDRQNGRKIYTQLVDSGFREVMIFSDMKDLSMVEFDDRDNLFKESFSYRINYFKRMLESDPNNEKIRQSYEWMQQALEQFEKQFFESNFWYCEYNYIGVGKK